MKNYLKKTNGWNLPRIRKHMHKYRIRIKEKEIESILNKMCMRKFGKILKIKVVLDRNNNPWYNNDEYVACMGRGQLNYNIMFLGYSGNKIYDTLIHEVAHHITDFKRDNYYFKGHPNAWAKNYLMLGGVAREVRRMQIGINQVNYKYY